MVGALQETDDDAQEDFLGKCYLCLLQRYAFEKSTWQVGIIACLWMSIKMEIADEGRVKHHKIAVGPKQLSMLMIVDDFLKVCSNE